MNARLWTVIATLAFGLFLAPFASEAQQPAKIPRIGFLGHKATTPTVPSPPLQAFRQGLSGLGYVEGRDIIIEARYSEGRVERFHELAAELVRLNVDVIAEVGAVTARAAMKTTTNIPIVFAVVVDPVADNLVASLERPGRNVTGITNFDPRQPRQQLELLKEALPGLKRVAILGDRGVSDALLKANEEQARALGLQTQSFKLAGPTPDFEGAFAAAKKERADAVLLLDEPIIGVNRKRIAELAATYRLPTMFGGDWVDAGGLIAYGTSFLEAAGRMPVYVDRILKGAKPGDLPVEKLTHYRLTINLKTAREIGVTIPPEVLKRADKVIE
jgi:putative tryptophan/tyrosine transport system substrate-binding protein